jgi:hypothetical protein
MPRDSLAVALIALLAARAPLTSQVIDLTVNDVGLAIGDKPEMTGLRLNFRDRNLREVKGVNSPLVHMSRRRKSSGWRLEFRTGARKIDGVALGVFGVGVSQSITGISIGGIEVGGGGQLAASRSEESASDQAAASRG